MYVNVQVSKLDSFGFWTECEETPTKCKNGPFCKPEDKTHTRTQCTNGKPDCVCGCVHCACSTHIFYVAYCMLCGLFTCCESCSVVPIWVVSLYQITWAWGSACTTQINWASWPTPLFFHVWNVENWKLLLWRKHIQLDKSEIDRWIDKGRGKLNGSTALYAISQILLSFGILFIKTLSETSFFFLNFQLVNEI